MKGVAIWNAKSDPQQVDYFPPVEFRQAFICLCVECGALVASDYKDRHIAWHKEAE